MVKQRLLPLLALLLAGVGASLAAETPTKVVSMNLCTDQLAMLLTDEDQLMSVSYLAQDPRASAMAEEAKRYDVNYGRAEEIYLLRPDLVIAGSFTTRATVDMLRRLDVPVVVFEPARSLEDVRDRILKMGRALHRTAAADALLAEYDAGLEQISREEADQPRAAIYSMRGWTQGERTLSGQILNAAGYRNIAAELGMSSGGILPLEQLALANPDVLITSQPYPGYSRAQEFLDHPVVGYLRSRSDQALISDRDWVCGTPYVLRAIETLADAHQANDRNDE